MYKPVAEGDTFQVAAFLNYFKTVYRWVGVAILIMGAFILPILDYLVTGEVPADVNMQLAFCIYLANASLSYFLYAYKQSLLNAYQRNDAINKVNMAIIAAQCLLQSTVLLIWPNFYAFALIMPVCTVASNLATAVVVRRLLPEFSDLSLLDARLNDKERIEIRKRVAGLVFSQLCRVSRNSFDNIIISSFIGLVAVASYGNYFVIMSGLLGVLGTIGTSMTAAVGNSVAVESKEKNFDDMRLFVFLYAMISTVCCACMLACYQPFMRIWVGDDLMLPMLIPVLMSVYFYVATMGDIRTVYVNATGIWWKLKWRALAEALSNLVLNLLLVQLFGLPGVVSATILSLFFLNFLYGSHLTFKHYFGMKYVRFYYIDHFIYMMMAIVVCVATYFVIGFIPYGGGVPNLLLKAMASVLVSSSILLVVFFWTKRFKRAISFAKHVITHR